MKGQRSWAKVGKKVENSSETVNGRSSVVLSQDSLWREIRRDVKRKQTSERTPKPKLLLHVYSTNKNGLSDEVSL